MKDKQTLNAWLITEQRKGTPAWHLYRQLSDIMKQSKDYNEMLILDQIMHSIEQKLVDRNLRGIELEKKGRAEEARLLYEANISDCFDGSHPYDRLRIFYKYRGDYMNAIRVCEAYIRNSGQDPKQSESYRKEINTLKAKIANG